MFSLLRPSTLNPVREFSPQRSHHRVPNSKWPIREVEIAECLPVRVADDQASACSKRREAPRRGHEAIPNVASQPKRPPVRVKLRRINTNLAENHPPDGETKVWWKRLKKALGTTPSDFVNASLLQLQAAARLPFNGTETAVNAAHDRTHRPER